MFTLSFSPTSLAEIARLAGFTIYLTEEVGIAMDEGGQLLEDAAIANTWATFTNPSGQLASTIHKIVDSPFEVQIGVGSPYGHRREYSFTGPDSLGRMFPNDPAAYYMTHALEDNEQAVLQLIDNAVERALNRIGGA